MARLACADQIPDGMHFVDSHDGRMRRMRTAKYVPVPTLFEAHSQHVTGRVMRRAGYTHVPPYHPDRLKEK